MLTNIIQFLVDRNLYKLVTDLVCVTIEQCAHCLSATYPARFSGIHLSSCSCYLSYIV